VSDDEDEVFQGTDRPRRSPPFSPRPWSRPASSICSGTRRTSSHGKTASRWWPRWRAFTAPSMPRLPREPP